MDPQHICEQAQIQWQDSGLWMTEAYEGAFLWGQANGPQNKSLFLVSPGLKAMCGCKANPL